MAWKHRLIKFFGLEDLFDSYKWDAALVALDIKESQVLRNTTILEGNCRCNLVLDEDVNLRIDGQLEGNIIGKGNNTVKIIGDFEDTISCDLFNIRSTGKLRGNIWVNKMIIQTGCILDGEVSMQGGQIGKLNPTIDKDDTFLLSKEYNDKLTSLWKK